MRSGDTTAALEALPPLGRPSTTAPRWPSAPHWPRPTWRRWRNRSATPPIRYGPSTPSTSCWPATAGPWTAAGSAPRTSATPDASAPYRCAPSSNPTWPSSTRWARTCSAALRHAVTAVTAYPDNLALVAHHARVLAEYGWSGAETSEDEVREALTQVERAVEISPDQPRYRAVRAQLAALLNDFDTALASIQRALDLEDSSRAGLRRTHRRVPPHTGRHRAAPGDRAEPHNPAGDRRTPGTLDGGARAAGRGGDPRPRAEGTHPAPLGDPGKPRPAGSRHRLHRHRHPDRPGPPRPRGTAHARGPHAACSPSSSPPSAPSSA